MTDKPAKTAERKRKKYVPYNSLPQKGLNIDDPYGAGELEAMPSEQLTLEDIATLLRVVKEKDSTIKSLVGTVNRQQDAMQKLFEDINYLKDELSNPNLFIAQ